MPTERLITIRHPSLRDNRRREPLYVVRDIREPTMNREIFIGIDHLWARYRRSLEGDHWAWISGHNLGIFTEHYLEENQTMITRAEFDRMRLNDNAVSITGSTAPDSTPRTGIAFTHTPANRDIARFNHMPSPNPSDLSVTAGYSSVDRFNPIISVNGQFNHPLRGVNAIETRVYCNKCPRAYSLHANTKCPECESQEYKLSPESKEVFINRLSVDQGISRAAQPGTSIRFTDGPLSNAERQELRAEASTGWQLGTIQTTTDNEPIQLSRHRRIGMDLGGLSGAVGSVSNGI